MPDSHLSVTLKKANRKDGLHPNLKKRMMSLEEKPEAKERREGETLGIWFVDKRELMFAPVPSEELRSHIDKFAPNINFPVQHDLLLCQPCETNSTIWYTCPQEGCDYKVKRRSHLKQHLADIHDIGVTWHTCPQEGCEYKAKQRQNIKRHLAQIHDIGVTWHTCPQEGCEYKTKKRDGLKQHLANVHDIGVTWHSCPQEGVVKSRGTLN